MKRPRPDTRLNWRNPNLPVLRDYKFGNGTTRTEIDPDYERRYRAHLMEVTEHPDWRDDPTYNLKRRRTLG